MKNKKPTPFYKAAEQIANSPTNLYEPHNCCCWIIGGFDNTMCSENWFAKYFEPTYEEAGEYGVDSAYWMWSHTNAPDQNRQDRVIALLFADQMWKDGIR